jgi:hypothetical protein
VLVLSLELHQRKLFNLLLQFFIPSLLRPRLQARSKARSKDRIVELSGRFVLRHPSYRGVGLPGKLVRVLLMNAIVGSLLIENWLARGLCHLSLSNGLAPDIWVEEFGVFLGEVLLVELQLGHSLILEAVLDYLGEAGVHV